MAGQGSARVTLKEIDLSQVRDPQILPQGVPAAVVGTARKGPAFVPRTFANIQQFEEVFGSMSTRGRESNSNRIGPLALNEWLKSANAGTFLRVLGVGDGKAADSSGKVESAGFVVGEELVQKVSGAGLSKVGKNQHATIADDARVAASALGKTHFLGCFMKDTANSNYLQESGVQTDNASGTLRIEFKAVPADDSVISLDSIGAGAETLVYGFKGGGGAAGADHTVNTTVKNTAELVATELFTLINTHHENLTATNPSDGVVVIQQNTAGVTGNTAVEYTLNSAARKDIIITSGGVESYNSTEGDTIRFDDGGTASASITLSIVDPETPVNIANGNTLILKALKDNRTLTDDVTITFANDATFNVNDDSVFKDGAAAALTVRIGENALDTLAGQKETLSNLATALNSDNESGLQGLLIATLSSDGETLTITQKNKGDVSPGGLDATASFTFAIDSFKLNDSAATNAQIDAAANGGFTGGTDGTATITFDFAGQPAVGDNFTLVATDETSERFVVVADNNGVDNAADNGSGDIKVERAESLGGFLTNLQAAIAGAASVISDLVTTEVVGDSITITQVTGGPAGDTEVIFNLNSNVTAKSSSSTLVGNFGEKTTSFAGGGGGASPIIRGVLMTPQGVRPSLSVPNNATLTADFVVDSDTYDLTKSAVNLDFGNTAAQDLAGYVIGEVSSQGFKLLLNGFNNSEAASELSCSFDPDSSSYFAKVLNTDPTKIEELGHYLYAWWDIDKEVAVPSNDGLLNSGAAIAAGDYSDMIGFLLDGAGGAEKPDYQNFESRYQTAKTPWIVSQKFGSDSYKLFRLHSLDDGEIGGTQYRLLVSDLRYVNDATYGSFTLSLERLGTNPVEGDVIASWKKLSLDPDSRNYIARVIGDQYLYYDFDRDDEKQRLQSKGNFDLRNNYVRIELSDDLLSGNVPVDALPTGFLGHAKLQTAISENFVEPGGQGGAKVFTDAGGDPLAILSEAQVAPIKFVRSLSRKVIGNSLEASDDLAWGIKFAKKENDDSLYKELSEIEYDPSIASYAKFFPSFGDKATQVMIEDNGTDLDDSDFEYDRFSLENIKINSFDAVNNRITDWAGAEYQRGGVSSGTAVQISRDAKSTNVKYLKFRCMFQGGFDGVNIFDAEKADLSGVASLREANDEKESKVYTGPTVVAYQKACDVLADKSAVELQVLALPGQRASAVTNYAMTACEERFDALYVMDIEEKDAEGEHIESDDYKPHVANTITHFSDRLLDSSFGAAYFPDLAVRRTSDNSAKVVPPSVGVLGVISRNDRIKAPWFAPAGLNRGRVNSPGVKLQMNRDLLNDLYDADVNPIYEPAGRGGEVYVFGQKTLLQGESALDRINVRRLLIDIRRKVKAIGESLLFEPNRESTLAKFSALVEPIMQDVQKRQGVARYKVQIDSSTTTQNDIENNTVRGKIYLQPLKSIEFISLDFVVTNTIE